MKSKMKYPYGESNFGFLIKEGYYYVDKTAYIEKLEEADENYVIFLRPRRFGKVSLFLCCSIIYGVEYATEFDSLFGKNRVIRERVK